MPAKKSAAITKSAKTATHAEPSIDALIEIARDARRRAYAPYSEYCVGAAILTRTGQVFTGCNVENATYGATICAERTAITKMVSEGGVDPIVCVVATEGPDPGSPCGICRQVLSEFARDMRVVLVSPHARRDTTLAELLPDAFRLRPA